jgi:hypothetical protein
MEQSHSYIAFGNPGQYEKIWDELFHDTKVLDTFRQNKLYLTLVGDIEDRGFKRRYLALILSSDGGQRMTQWGWRYFMESLREYTPTTKYFELEFNQPKIILNIYGFAYSHLHQHTIVADPESVVYEYYKSGTMLMFSTCANTYGELSPPENVPITETSPITRSLCGEGYSIVIPIAGQRRRFEIVLSVAVPICAFHSF